jgi:flavin-dependent dehydrogenase
MKKYDVIIVGAGIAGCGLAYNLKRAGYKGSVLVIDKKGIGSNRGHGYRIIAEDKIDPIKEYGIPYIHKFRGMKSGVEDEVIVSFRCGLYLIKYRGACKYLFSLSDAKYKKENVEDVSLQNILVTSKNQYSFKYLIDCSGISYFLREKFNLPKPFRYWIAFPGKQEKRIKFDKNYYYNLMDDENTYLVEFLFNGSKFLKTFWQNCYGSQFKLMKDEKEPYYSVNIQHKRKIKQSDFIMFPTSPVFPLVYKNYAFLGDSCGIAPPLSGAGINICLKISKLLARALKQNSLKTYEKEWKKKYLKAYIKNLCARVDRSNNSEFLRRIKKYPSVSETLHVLKKDPKYYVALIKDDLNELPSKEIRKFFPKRRLLFLALYYLYFKVKYLFMQLIQ